MSFSFSRQANLGLFSLLAIGLQACGGSSPSIESTNTPLASSPTEQAAGQMPPVDPAAKMQLLAKNVSPGSGLYITDFSATSRVNPLMAKLGIAATASAEAASVIALTVDSADESMIAAAKAWLAAGKSIIALTSDATDGKANVNRFLVALLGSGMDSDVVLITRSEGGSSYVAVPYGINELPEAISFATATTRPQL